MTRSLLLLRRLYWSLGIDLQKFQVSVNTGIRAWHRPFDRLPLHGIGAEIGVYRGIHAKTLLRLHPIKELWLVDPYEPYIDKWDAPMLRESEKSAHRILAKYGSRIRWLRMSSTKGVRHLPPLDFCYIDGAHGYNYVRSDIEHLWPLIKPGGIIGGHDFFPDFPGNIRAVTEFSVKHHLELIVDTPDWWIVKPK